MNKQLEQVSRVTTDCVSFTWKVENFPSLSVRTGEFIRSSVVKFSDSYWCLKLFPYGKYKPNQVEVYLEHVGLTGLPTLPSGVKCKIGLRNRSGKSCFELSLAVPACTPNENKREPSAGTSTSLENVHTTVTTDSSSTRREPHEPLINTTTPITQSSSFLSSGTVDCVSLEKQATASSFVSPTSPVITTASNFFGNNACTFTTTATTNTQGYSFAFATANSSFSEKLANFTVTTTAPSFLARNSNASTSTTAASASKFSSGSFLASGTNSPRASTSDLFSFSGDVKSKPSSFEFYNYSSPAGTRAKGSASKSTSSTDKPSRENNIQPQSPILASISTTAPNSCFLDESEKTPGSTWASKSVCFLEANERLFLNREFMFKMAEDLLPNDVLSILCEMEVTLVVKVSESTQIHESASSNDGTKLLIENLQNAFKNPIFSDVTLKVGDVQFPAHKVILANRSKVFGAMFDTEMKESHENVVDLVEMKPSTARDMLSYVYTGRIRDLSMGRATDLFVAADRYDMPELKQWCKDFILKHISPDFACDVATLANLHGDEDLAKASKLTIRNNLKKVLNSEKWLSLSKESPAVYLELLQVALLDESD